MFPDNSSFVGCEHQISNLLISCQYPNLLIMGIAQGTMIIRREITHSLRKGFSLSIHRIAFLKEKSVARSSARLFFLYLFPHKLIT